MAGGYLLAVAASGGYVTYQFLFSTARASVANIVFIILGLPWSVALGRLLPNPSALSVASVVGLAIAINTGLFFLAGGLIEQVVHSARRH